MITLLKKKICFARSKVCVDTIAKVIYCYTKHNYNEIINYNHETLFNYCLVITMLAED